MFPLKLYWQILGRAWITINSVHVTPPLLLISATFNKLSLSRHQILFIAEIFLNNFISQLHDFHCFKKKINIQHSNWQISDVLSNFRSGKSRISSESKSSLPSERQWNSPSLLTKSDSLRLDSTLKSPVCHTHTYIHACIAMGIWNQGLFMLVFFFHVY